MPFSPQSGEFLVTKVRPLAFEGWGAFGVVPTDKVNRVEGYPMVGKVVPAFPSVGQGRE